MLIKHLGLKYPLIVAPMAGGPTTVELVAASSNAGTLGSIGAAYMAGPAIEDFTQIVRLHSARPIAINLFIPHKISEVSSGLVEKAIQSTQIYRHELHLPRPELKPPYEEDFDQQFEATLKARPEVISFVFGLLDQAYVRAAQKEKVYLIGTATTLEEALALEESGVDAITLQGVEAGGHRGIFDANIPDPQITAFDLLERCVERIKIPLIAAGGIMNKSDIQKALKKGAQAVQMGTAFLACKESGISLPYREALLKSDVRKTQLTRAFSGRIARGIENRFLNEMIEKSESILPFPAQNKFTRDLRNTSSKIGSSDFLSLWSGSGEGKLWTGSAHELILSLFES